MARVTKVDAVVEIVETVITPEKYIIELSEEEMKGLRHLLGYGVHYKSSEKLNLTNLFNSLPGDFGYKSEFGSYDKMAQLSNQ